MLNWRICNLFPFLLQLLVLDEEWDGFPSKRPPSTFRMSGRNFRCSCYFLSAISCLALSSSLGLVSDYISIGHNFLADVLVHTSLLCKKKPKKL
eukprot:4290151-Amphidinium_carterae.1